MKTLRLFVVMMIVVLVLSAWAPAPAAAQTVSAQGVSLSGDFAKSKLATLTVDNRTGGTLYVTLSGPKYYSFSATKAGKTTFKNIEPGKYSITVRSSACGGSMTFDRNIKGSANLKGFVCRK